MPTPPTYITVDGALFRIAEPKPPLLVQYAGQFYRLAATGSEGAEAGEGLRALSNRLVKVAEDAEEALLQQGEQQMNLDSTQFVELQRRLAFIAATAAGAAEQAERHNTVYAQWPKALEMLSAVTDELMYTGQQDEGLALKSLASVVVRLLERMERAQPQPQRAVQ